MMVFSYQKRRKQNLTVRKECNSVKNDIASLNEKIRKIETSDLNKLHLGNLNLFRRTDKLSKEIITTNKFINTHAILREVFLRFLELSGLRKLVQQQLDKKS